MKTILNIPLMTIHKKNLFIIFCLCFHFVSAREKILKLWPSLAPGEITGQIEAEKQIKPKPGGNDVMRIANVSEPTISVHMPTPAKSNGTAVIVCPGGGYNILAYEHEGIQVCNWLNDLGVTAILLKYRVPRRKGRQPHEAPLQDLQRAYGIVRQNAKNWKIDPEKVGVLGFSAGGNLAMMGLTSFHERSYEKLDEADNFSCRPDFGILIYPAYLVDREKRTTLFSEIKITSETPPCFFVHTGDDRVPAEGSVLAYLALEKAGVNGNELHVYPFGGHGYGMRKTDNPVSQWPIRAATWMKAMGWINTQ